MIIGSNVPSVKSRVKETTRFRVRTSCHPEEMCELPATLPGEALCSICHDRNCSGIQLVTNCVIGGWFR